MRIRDLIPGVGQSDTRKRWRKLEKKAVTLPVFFALFFTKSIEIIVLAAPEFPMSEVLNAFTMFILSIVTGAAYIYGVELDIEDIAYDE